MMPRWREIERQKRPETENKLIDYQTGEGNESQHWNEFNFSRSIVELNFRFLPILQQSLLMQHRAKKSFYRPFEVEIMKSHSAISNWEWKKKVKIASGGCYSAVNFIPRQISNRIESLIRRLSSDFCLLSIKRGKRRKLCQPQIIK